MMVALILLLAALCASFGVTIALFIAHAPELARPRTARFYAALAFPTVLGVIMATSADFPAFLFGGLAGSLVMWMDLSKKVKSQ